MSYTEAMENYGSDKPDIRFDMKIQNISEVVKDTEFVVFANAIKDGGSVRAIVAKNGASVYTRKEIDKLTEYVKGIGAKGLAYVRWVDDEPACSFKKFMKEGELENILSNLGAEKGDVVFIVADKKKIVQASLGALRLKLAKDFNLIDESKYNFLWVTNFPMFEYSEEEERFVAAHHPFTAPNKEDLDKLLTDKANCYSRAYDLVLNGYELLSGSVRIHDNETQSKVFEAIGLSLEEAKEKFGFFLEAFKYGAPPHCGVGVGLERLVMILVGTDNIRDVVAFPKTASATCLMSEAPNLVDEKQLKELKINIEK